MQIITSVNNLIIKNTLALKDKTGRINAQEYIIEGYHLLEEALKTNNVVKIFSTDKSVLKYDNIIQYQVTDQIIKKLASSKTPQNVIAVVKMDNYHLDDYSPINKVILLDDISDPGNLGTVIRTSASLGFDAIILSPNCVDLYNDKVIRATQGSIYKIKIYTEDLNVAIDNLQKNNVYIYGTSLSNNSIDILNVEKHDKFALILGNEAHGVSNDILSKTNQNIKIQMQNDVESLNIAVAGSICMWELLKK
jgi:TrmH family RNA methyltransferase